MAQAIATTNSPHTKGRRAPAQVDAERLASALRSSIRGEVRFDNGSRALYATDASNYRQVPIGVVIPRDADDVIQALAIAREFGAPILARGGGTSLAGQCCNVALVLDTSKYFNRIVEVDPERRTARVEPGVVLDSLQKSASEHGLMFAPDPSTHSHCTLGGMIGNNSCGVHSMMGGKTVDNIEELEILTYDGLQLRVGKTSEHELVRIINEGGRRGEIYQNLKALRDKYAGLIRARYPKIPRRVSGYNLDYLLPENGFDLAKALVGSECTCVLILEATVRLVAKPPARSLLVLGYEDVYSAGDHVTEALAHKPIGLEGLDDRLIEDMKALGLHPESVKLLPEGAGWLLVEFGGETKAEADERAQALMDDLRRNGHPPSMKLFDDEHEEKMIWKVRESGLGATAHVPNKKITWEGWEDAAVPPEKLGDYLRDFRRLLQRYEYEGDLYGHFGQGCIHTRTDFDLETHDGIKKFRSFLENAADLVISYGGSLSGEHGDGQSRGWLLPKMFGFELVEAFREFKSIWDADWKMNPGKKIDPYDVETNLRLGTDYRPAHHKTHFKFPKDIGDFTRVSLRCVGVGECRRLEGGTMCPSYRATMEEKHSTRGRARLLWEMLRGEVIKDEWKSEEVKDALDLCLACKGCKKECPVSVDMATYKAEFLSHYYEGSFRPRHAYAFGYVDRFARIASFAPGLVNFFTQTQGFAEIAKTLTGMPEERTIPKFARQSFKRWYKQRERAGPKKNGTVARPFGSAQVILWPDTFNNYFFPTTTQAATAVLEAAGFCVTVPSEILCCGRPLYDFGMLGRAKRLLRQILKTLRQPISEGVPVIVLEPSCLAVFRDEMPNLFPDDEDAKRLCKQTYLFSEFITRKTEYDELPLFARNAIVHGHCHQKALIGMDADELILKRMGLNFQVLDSGCCGMAGSFGFEKDHYDISMQIGEQVLLPAVRNTTPETLIIANGFSCREQIAQATGRHALHLAEIMAMAFDNR